MSRVLAGVLVAVLLAIATGFPAMAQAEKAAPDANARDHFIGWFALPGRQHRSHRVIPGRDTLIPVFKRDGIYYSVCKGIEVPLKECPGGLEWGLEPSSMVGTKFTYDEAAESYFITIVDQREANNNEYSLSGEKQPVKKAAKPAEVPDATAERPRSNDDFVGWYQLLWLPMVRYEIRKEGGKYAAAMWMARSPGGWQAGGSSELTPLPDRLGFSLGGKGAAGLVYNEAAGRFEIVSGKSGQPSLTTPLARIKPPASPEKDAVPMVMSVGIPSW